MGEDGQDESGSDGEEHCAGEAIEVGGLERENVLWELILALRLGILWLLCRYRRVLSILQSPPRFLHLFREKKKLVNQQKQV